MIQASRDWAKSYDGGALASEELDCTYNLFRKTKYESLICAIPVDRPVPGFMSGQDWWFVRALHALDRLPPGFLVRAASDAVRFNGFYLFYLTAGVLLKDNTHRSPASDLEIRAHVRAILQQLRVTQ